MKDIRWGFIVTISVFLLGFLSACGSESSESQSSDQGNTVTLKFAFELPNDHPWGKGAKKFKDIVEEKSEGSIKVELHGAGSLAGSGREIQEGAKVGTIDVGISSTPMAQMNPYVDIFSLPYIFQDRENAWEILDGEIGEQVGKRLKKNNLKHLAYWEDGFRQVTNSVKPIEKPSDFEGLRIRVPESDLRIETFKALGAEPLPMSWSEVFTALQQGAIDGQENPLSVIDSASFYDVQSHLTVTNHVYSPATLFMNLDKWNSLSKEQQKIILEASKAGRDLNRNLNKEQDEDLINQLEEKGMDVRVIDDITPFQEVTKPVWDSVTDELGGKANELVQKIIETQN